MKLKHIFLAAMVYFTSIAIAQANNSPIPVATNENITVTLFFPSEIATVIKPSINFLFDYEPQSNMGTLIGQKGTTSNLTVITKDGSIYSFLLQYDKVVENFTYVLSEDQAIGNMASDALASPTIKSQAGTYSKNVAVERHPESKKAEGTTLPPSEQLLKSELSESYTISNEKTPIAVELSENNLYDTDRESYYGIFCENNYDQKMRNLDVKSGIGMKLQLNALTADKNEFYFVLEITNRLKSNLDVNKLRFYVRSSRRDKPLQVTPLYIFNDQKEIKAGQSQKVVYVLKQFRLSKDQKVFVVLDEQKGTRNTILNIDSETINMVGQQSVTTTL